MPMSVVKGGQFCVDLREGMRTGEEHAVFLVGRVEQVVSCRYIAFHQWRRFM